MYHSSESPGGCAGDLRTFVRNRYFYGKLLDVHHFESEQSYLNGKRWLLNQFVTGYGVVCGLDVCLSSDGTKLYVEPGIAIDQAGREIIVPRRSKSVDVPALPPPPPPQAAEREESGDHCHDDHNVFHLCIRYLECPGEPEPVRAPDRCLEEEALSSPSAIRERYELELMPGRAPKPDDCDIPDLFSGGRIDHCALARYVTRACPEVPENPCIPLANVCLQPEGKGADVDITVRPIVYTNDLLYELIVNAINPNHNRPRAGK